jgi:hypothetical protein
MKKLLFVCAMIFVVGSSFAESYSINVFANVDGAAGKQIEQVNSAMKQANIYSDYKISPFADSHNVHLTMYLTKYQESQLVNVENTVKGIAANTSSFSVSSSGVTLKASDFLMLDVANTPRLQILTDKLVASLSKYRDVNTVIPAWAINYPEKVQMFQEYGSPNVYEGFDPHFSIFAAKIPSDGRGNFDERVDEVIDNLNFSATIIQITSLGIGIADENGQIVKVIKEYSFKK